MRSKERVSTFRTCQVSSPIMCVAKEDSPKPPLQARAPPQTHLSRFFGIMSFCHIIYKNWFEKKMSGEIDTVIFTLIYFQFWFPLPPKPSFFIISWRPCGLESRFCALFQNKKRCYQFPCLEIKVKKGMKHLGKCWVIEHVCHLGILSGLLCKVHNCWIVHYFFSKKKRTKKVNLVKQKREVGKCTWKVRSIVLRHVLGTVLLSLEDLRSQVLHCRVIEHSRKVVWIKSSQSTRSSKQVPLSERIEGLFCRIVCGLNLQKILVHLCRLLVLLENLISSTNLKKR